MAFRIADDNDLLLIDLKDLQRCCSSATTEEVHHQVWQYLTGQHRCNPARLIRLESQGADKFFGEPELEITDFIQTEQGKGVINILAADKLIIPTRLHHVFTVVA